MKRSPRDCCRPQRAVLFGRPKAAAIVAALVLGGLLTAPAAAGPHLFVGIDDSSFLSYPAATLPVAQDLGLKALRVTVSWYPGQVQISQGVAAELRGLATSVPGMRVVVSVYAPNSWLIPQGDSGRNLYCAYVGSILQDVPQINDIVIWNEPNLSFFWTPQYNKDGSSAAPAAYEALLARCYDVLHSVRPNVNVIAPATCPRGNDIPWAPENISHSPGQFILGMGEAYRQSGRKRPIFDTVGHHIYGTYSAERPWRVHSNSTAISEGDWGALMTALTQAFEGTAQPIPGECSGRSCVSIWYLEAGYQTTVDPAKAMFYTGVETWEHLVPAAGGPPDPPAPADTSWAPDQATQLRDGLRLAYCQPYVDAFFNFLLQDEPDLGRWQSGVLWADGTPKPSYPAFKETIGDVNSGNVDCSAVSANEAAAGAVAAPGRASGPGGTAAAAAHAARPKPLRLVLSVRRRALAGSVVHVWLRFNRSVKNERVLLLRIRHRRAVVVKRRTVSGFAPALKLRPPKPGRYTVRVAYQVGSRYRFTRVRTVAVVRRTRPRRG